jgi:hypothetical protein
MKPGQLPKTGSYEGLSPTRESGSASMRAALCIETRVGNAQPLDGLTADQMFLHNSHRVFGLNIAVPDCLWIYHHCWSVFTLIEAPGLVDAHHSGQPIVLCQLLQCSVKIALAVGGARWARCTLWAHVMTYKYVVLKCGQSVFLLMLGVPRLKPSLPSAIQSPTFHI